MKIEAYFYVSLHDDISFTSEILPVLREEDALRSLREKTYKGKGKAQVNCSVVFWLKIND